MPDLRKCMKCGADLPADSPAGQCVRCLLEFGFDSAEEPVFPTQVVVPVTEKPDDFVGRYKLLEKVGEGGCGVVYVAEQTAPVRRRVAVKVIKLGMDTKQVVARFEVERQALAMMDHPNIAKVLDAGTTETGRPYFVMELVRGIKITDYCDQNNLNTHQRLDLFIQVCQAIQHAHQKGIIHRDIKPSNILVTLHDGMPVPKVIDFGIAKATEGRLASATVYTQLHQFIGTPAYMSPEQAEMSGLDIDTRSDIYSLGVLLYELLAGMTPFDAKELMSQGIDAMRKTIREKEPMRPSTKAATLQGDELSTTAARHAVEAPKLISLLRGDLDWIVMKCLEKDRMRRYETANGLAADLKRHLDNEPVVARPQSAAYRFQKSLKRNKLAYAAAAAVAMALIIGLGAATWMFARERLAHYRAVAAEREQSRLRVEEAKEKVAAQQSLYNSLLGEARATRLARHMGYREEVFRLLQQARDLHVPQKDLADLRREAVACLGDFVGLGVTTVSDFPTNLDYQDATLDPAGKLAAFDLSDGTIQLREIPSGKVIARLTGLTGTTSPVSFSFNSTGDQLFALFQPTTGTPEQNIAQSRLFVWAGGPDGVWWESENSLLPGADQLCSSTAGVFALTIDFLTSPPGELTGSRNQKFRLLDLKTGVFVPGIAMTNIVGFALSPDGRFLATETTETYGRNETFLDLWDFKTGRRLNRLEADSGSQTHINFSPDGKYLARLSKSGGAIYTVPNFQRIGDFKEYFIAFAAFAKDLVALPIDQQRRIRLWNLVAKEDVAYLDTPEEPWQVLFPPDGSFLLTHCHWSAWLYHLTTPEKLNLPPHETAVTGVAFSPDGAFLASVGKDRVVRVCDAMMGRILWQTNGLPGPGQCVGYSPDGKWLATGDDDTGLVCIWDAQTGRRLLQLGTNGEGQTFSAEFSPDGRYFATAGGLSGSNNTIKIWSIASSRPDEAGGSVEARLLKSWESGISLTFAPDSRSLAFDGSYENTNESATLYLWDFETPTQPHPLGSAIPGVVQNASFTPDGRQVLTLDSRGEILTLDVATGKEISSFKTVDPQFFQQTGSPNLLFRLSPDGSRLALSSASGLGVDIWNPKTGKLLYSLPGENGTVYWLAWSPDSRRLAVARDNGSIAIWNLDTVGQILTQLRLNP